MADQAGEHEKPDSPADSVVDEITEKLHRSDSSSDSDDNNDIKSAVFAAKAKIYHMFGREQPVHKVLGGGKPADIFLWRDKKVSAGVLGVATTIWVIFELIEYHLLSLVCHILTLGLVILFVWSKASAVINKSPPRIPEVVIPEDIVRHVASVIRIEINNALAVLRYIASGREVKKFLAVIAGLWVVSVLGNSFNFLTLLYIGNLLSSIISSIGFLPLEFPPKTGFLLLHSVPLFYEKYEEQVDAFAEKAEAEIKKQYAVLQSQVLSKIPHGALKEKKFQ